MAGCSNAVTLQAGSASNLSSDKPWSVVQVFNTVIGSHWVPKGMRALSKKMIILAMCHTSSITVQQASMSRLGFFGLVGHIVAGTSL